MKATGQFLTPKETYDKIAKGARTKLDDPFLVSLLKSVFGGWCIGLGGYCASVLASLYYEPGGSNGAARAAFGILFPTGLMALLLTGTDLYTGSTMSYTFALARRYISFLHYLYKLTLCLVGNFIGAAICALILAGGTNHFGKGTGNAALYLAEMGKAKTQKPFWRLMMSAIGSNSLVCLAVFTFFACNDSAGGIITVIVHIGCFACGGLEHIIANFFLLNECLVSQADVTFLGVYVNNFIPVLLGNTIAGVFVIGTSLAVLYNGPNETQKLDAESTDGVEIKVLTA